MPIGLKRFLNIKIRLFLLFVTSFLLLFFTVFFIIITNNYLTIDNHNKKYYDYLLFNLSKNINYMSLENTESLKKINIDDYTSIETGFFYILGPNNNILYFTEKSNIDFDIDKVINDDDFIKIINNETNYKFFTAPKNTKIINYRFSGNKYQLYILESKLLNMDNIKFVYFYPKKNILLENLNVIIISVILFLIINIILGIYILTLGNSLSYPLNKFNYAIEKVSQGYLDVDLISESKDEIGILFRNFKRMLRAHIEIISNIQKSSNNVKGYQGSLNKLIMEFDERLQIQKNLIDQIIDKQDSLKRSIEKIYQIVKDTKGIINQVMVNSDLSTNMVREMSGEIDRISETIEQVNFITEIINIISEKTRLIAVNSAIEASRAGEAGKSFGVVADEIRKLARLAHNAANEIGELIKINEKRVGLSVDKIKEVIEVLTNVNSSIKMINEANENIINETESENINIKNIMEINNNFVNNLDKNIKSIFSLNKMKGLLDNSVEDIRSIAHAFILKSDKTEIIKDYNIISKNEKNKIREENEKRKKEKNELKRSLKEKKKISRKKEKNVGKIDSVKALTLYKPKKSFFNISVKK